MKTYRPASPPACSASPTRRAASARTTTAINLAAGLATHCMQRVLLVDLDPQGNATMGSGIDKSDRRIQPVPGAYR